MSETATGTDMGVGLAMLFGAIALAGVVGMYLGVETHVYAATGFGVAILAGALGIAALHLYDA